MVVTAAPSLRLGPPWSTMKPHFEMAYGVEEVSLLVEEETHMCVFDGGTQRAEARRNSGWVLSLS